MAQLSNDCFAFGGRLMPLEDGLALLATSLPVLADVETVPLAAADGRVLALDVVSPMALPPFDNSAVDGWGVRAADLAASGETVLRVGARIAAGGTAEGVRSAGVAVRLFTGAPVPAGVDTVFMQEDVTLAENLVVLPAGLAIGANLRCAGEDVARGAPLLSAGLRLRPQDVALAAAVGQVDLAVRRPLRVGVFSTGDELRNPGEPLGPGAIYDSNRALLIAMARRAGAVVQDLGILADEPTSLAARLVAVAAEHDVLITSGGVSTGEEDHVRAAITRAGTLAFWRLAIKPGRPVAVGRIGTTVVVALPGNPAAVFITFSQVVRPLLAHLGAETLACGPPRRVRLGFPYAKKAGRREFVRVTLREGVDGFAIAEKFSRDGAGLLTSLTQTDGIVVLPETWTAIAAGTLVDVQRYAELW